MQMGCKTYQADLPRQYATGILTFLAGVKSGKIQILCSTLISQMMSLTGAFQNEHPQSTLIAKIKTILIFAYVLLLVIQ